MRAPDQIAEAPLEFNDGTALGNLSAVQNLFQARNERLSRRKIDFE
jgi:hypothetical protein